MSVYKVIEMIGTSESSWEDAAATAITSARQSVRGLRVAEVVEQDIDLAEGDTPEPMARLIGEEQVAAAADMLVANTDDEARQLIDLYDADPARVEVVHPGVDLDTYDHRS